MDGRERRFVCSLWGGGELHLASFSAVCCDVLMRLMICRYEDEKVIQALEILKKEAGFPFVEYI
jgi:hypothetical protein